MRNVVSRTNVDHAWARARVRQVAAPGTLRSIKSEAAPRVAAGEAWWAWEDLNFRPHAYQARALTN